MRNILTTAFADLKSDPLLIASLHRDTPSPRLKPTLVAALEQQRMVPTVGGNDAVRDEIAIAAASFAPVGASEIDTDAIGSLIAAAANAPQSDDLNEYERARLASLSPFEGNWGEGDAEATPGWSVQIGAYSTKAMAQKELEAAAIDADLVDRTRTVQPMLDASGVEIYRARFTAMSATEAAQACDTLRSHKVSCFLISEPQAQ
jgi:D-alanyl-D-alanine carboxypeptidase